MKLKRKQKLTIILGIAVLFIIYGLLDMTFKFNISKKIVDNVSMVLMIAAFGLLFSDRAKKVDPAQTDTNSSIQDTAAHIETRDNGQDNNSDNNNAGDDKTTETISNDQDDQNNNTKQ